MTFAYTNGTTNSGQTATASTGTHGITINSGDLVCVYVNRNGTGSLTPVDAGWTTAIDEIPTSETARQALYWKVAGASEGTAYTFTMGGGSDYWHVAIKVFTAGDTPTVDAAANSDRSSVSDSNDMLCSAYDGQVISTNAVAVIFGGKDNRGAVTEAYNTANNSYTGVIGHAEHQATCGAHRIYTTGETASGNITIEDADSDDTLPDYTYSIHMSFVEGGGGTSIPLFTHYRQQV